MADPSSSASVESMADSSSSASVEPMADSFPRQYARTQRLTLGEPRNITVSPDGERIVFLRSSGGSDPVHRLWVSNRSTGSETLVADPLALLAAQESDLPPEERRRRERLREGAAGITSYATDSQVTVAAFTLSGRLFICGLISGVSRELAVEGPVYDPRPDPSARRLAYISQGALRVANLDGTSWEVAGDPDPDVTWGLAEFIAAEEMGRGRGYWWSPDGTRLIVARVDNRAVATWWLSNPTDPAEGPTALRYPHAGSNNADVSLAIVDLNGVMIQVIWDRDLFPYLTNVVWSHNGLLIAVQSRDQRHVEYRLVDETTGATTLQLADTDPLWVELAPGVPTFLTDGRLLTCADRGGARRLLVDGEPITPPSMQVRSVVSTAANEVIFTAGFQVDPIHQQVWRWTGTLERVSLGAGVHTAIRGGPTIVLRTTNLDNDGATTMVVGGQHIRGVAESPLVQPNVTFVDAGDRSLVAALLMPTGWNGESLPVLLDPYGWSALAAGCRFAARVSVVAMVRRPRLRRVDRRRPRHTWSRQRVGTCCVQRPRHAGPRRSDRRVAVRRRAVPPPRPHPGWHSRLELRRVPCGTRCVAAARRVSLRHSGCAGHRLEAVRHPLHRALPRSSGRSPRPTTTRPRSCRSPRISFGRS